MLDHVGLEVSGFGSETEIGPKPYFWIHGRGRELVMGAHLAFACPDRGTVGTLDAAAPAAGGTDNGGPGPRPAYHPRYYGASVLDPDGNNVEAVCHTA